MSLLDLLKPVINAARPAVTSTARGLGALAGQLGQATRPQVADVGRQAVKSITSNIGPSLSAAGHAGLRGLNTPVGRTAASGIGGYAAGAGGAVLSGNENIDPHQAGLALGGLAAGITGARNPWVQSQLRYAAGVAPGANFRPVRDTANMLFRPHYPVVEPFLHQQLPRAGPMITNTMRRTPMAAMGIGTTMAAGSAARHMPDSMVDMASEHLGVQDEATQNRIWWDTFKRQPEMLWRTYAPSALGGDNTAMRQLHQDALSNVVLPDLKHGPSRARRAFPGWMAAADTLRSTTPAGAAATYALRATTPTTAPTTGADIARVLEQNRAGLVNDPNLSRSPLARIYGDILMRPDVLRNARIGQIPTRMNEQIVSPSLLESVRTGIGQSATPMSVAVSAVTNTSHGRQVRDRVVADAANVAQNEQARINNFYRYR